MKAKLIILYKNLFSSLRSSYRLYKGEFRMRMCLLFLYFDRKLEFSGNHLTFEALSVLCILLCSGDFNPLETRVLMANSIQLFVHSIVTWIHFFKMLKKYFLGTTCIVICQCSKHNPRTSVVPTAKGLTEKTKCNYRDG